MACKKCKKTKCCCKKISICDDSCVGCLHKHSTECITLETVLDCIDSPVGTDLTTVLGEFCTEITTIQENIETVEETIENLTASQITVEALDCIGESNVTDDLQSVLEDICASLTDLQDGIVDPDADWFVSGTTDVPYSINDDIYHLGSVGIGLAAPLHTLHVTGDVLAEYLNRELYIGDTKTITTPNGDKNYQFFIGQADGSAYSNAILGQGNSLRFGTDFSTGVGTAQITTDLATGLAALNLNVTTNAGTSTNIQMRKDIFTLNFDTVESVRFDPNSTAGNTRFMIYDVDNATLERVSVGIADSGGAGFKLLRIAN